MDYRISYRSEFSTTGTHYNQTLSVRMSANEISRFNNAISERKKAIDKMFIRGWNESQFQIFARHLKKGLNFTTLTTRDFFCKFFGIIDKRLKDRNTLIKITLVGI